MGASYQSFCRQEQDMKPETAETIVEVVVGLWLLAMAFVLFLAPFVVIGLAIIHLWGAA